MQVRVYQMADGQLRVLHPAANAALDEAAAIAEQQDATLSGRPHVDVDVASLPSRAERFRWRLSGGAVVADASVPDPAASDRTVTADATFYRDMEAATTIAGIKAATLKWMQSRPGVHAPGGTP